MYSNSKPAGKFVTPSHPITWNLETDEKMILIWKDSNRPAIPTSTSVNSFDGFYQSNAQLLQSQIQMVPSSSQNFMPNPAFYQQQQHQQLYHLQQQQQQANFMNKSAAMPQNQLFNDLSQVSIDCLTIRPSEFVIISFPPRSSWQWDLQMVPARWKWRQCSRPWAPCSITGQLERPRINQPTLAIRFHLTCGTEEKLKMMYHAFYSMLSAQTTHHYQQPPTNTSFHLISACRPNVVSFLARPIVEGIKSSQIEPKYFYTLITY